MELKFLHFRTIGLYPVLPEYFPKPFHVSRVILNISSVFHGSLVIFVIPYVYSAHLVLSLALPHSPHWQISSMNLTYEPT